MKKITFAKIIELDNSQILVQKAFNNEDDNAHFQILVTTQFLGVEPKITLGFEDEESRDEAFDKYDIEHAQKFEEDIIELIS